MDPLNQFLVEQWDSSWDGEGWFAPWTKALGDLSAVQAAWIPPHGGHSIWQIVSHVTFWRSVTLNSAEGKPRPSDEECNRHVCLLRAEIHVGEGNSDGGEGE